MGMMPGFIDTRDPLARHPLNAGLAAHWLAIKGWMGGAKSRDLCRRYDGTLTGGATWGMTTRQAGSGELRFDGVTGQVVAPQPAGISATYSAAGWAHLASTTLNGPFIKVGGPGAGAGLGVGNGTFDTAGNDLIFLAEGNAWISASTGIGTGWHHAGFSVDGVANTIAVYLDGRHVLTQPQGVIPLAGSTYLGGYTAVSSANRYLLGSLDDWSLYGRVLSPGEFAALYGLSRRGYPGVLNRVQRPNFGIAAAAVAAKFRRTLGLRAGSRGVNE